MKSFNKRGEEIPDDTPVELPVGFRHPPSLAEEIRRMVEVNLSQAAERDGFEGLEEASDFEVEDEAELVVSNLQVQTMADDAIMEEDARRASLLVEELRNGTRNDRGQVEQSRSADVEKRVGDDGGKSGEAERQEPAAESRRGVEKRGSGGKGARS